MPTSPVLGSMDGSFVFDRSPRNRRKSTGMRRQSLLSDLSDSVSAVVLHGIQSGFSTSSDSFSNIDRGSDWEDGIQVLDSILKPGSVAFAALTTEQAEGIRKVRSMLLDAATSTSSDQLQSDMHVPRGLMARSDSSSEFVLAQFGGVQRRDAKKSIQSVINANRFIRGLKLKAASSRQLANTNAYPLEEWLDLSVSSQQKLRELLSWKSLKEWDFDVFELERLTQGRPLLFMGWAILSSPYSQFCMQSPNNEEAPPSPKTLENMPGYHFIDNFRIPQANMAEFLRAMEDAYDHKAPYHNNIHAADVLQSLHSLSQKCGGRKFATCDLDLLSILLAAVVHDVGHPGRNNNFQVNSRTALALQYNDTSVLENHHVSFAFSKLLGPSKDPKLDIFENLNTAQISTIRKMIIDAVLHTDMTKHFASVNQIKNIVLARITNIDVNGSDSGGENDGKYTDQDSWRILHFLLHLADISNPAKPLALATQWTDRCLEEFFAQGDNEKRLGLPVSPLCDRDTTNRAESQIGFLKFVVLPALETVAVALPLVADEVLPHATNVMEYWKEEKQAEKDSLLLDQIEEDQNGEG